MSNNSEAEKEIKKAKEGFKYVVETWEEFEKAFRDNTDGFYYDPFPELIKLVGESNLKDAKEIETMTKALKSGRSESSIEGYLGQLKDAAARKGLQIYAVSSPEGSGRTLRLVDKNLDFKTMFTRFKALQKKRSEAEKQEYELLKKVIEATPSIDLMKYDKFGRGVNQHVRVQSREAIVLNSNDEIMSIQNTTLGLKKLINKMKDMPVVQVNNLNDTKISTYIDQMKQMKKELNYIWQKELESQQMLSAQRVKNTAYNRDQGDIFENATAYTETAQFFGALSYDLVPVMNQLWAKFHDTTEFRKKYQRKSFYRNMKDVVDFQRDFNEVVTTAMMYANPVYQDEGIKKFQEYLKTEKPHFGVMRKSLDSLFEYIKKSGTTHGMRSEGSTGNLNQMKIPTIASALVAESDVKGKKNSLANVVQERTSKYALKNPFESLIKEIKRQPGEEAYYLRGEITEQDLLNAYKEYFDETFGKRVVFNTKNKTLTFTGTDDEKKKDKAAWEKELKEHPELMNFVYGLTNDQAIVRSSLRNQDLVNLYTVPKEIKPLDYEKILDDLKKSALGDQKDFNKILDKLTKKSWNSFKEHVEYDWSKNPELMLKYKDVLRSKWAQQLRDKLGLAPLLSLEGKTNAITDADIRFDSMDQFIPEDFFGIFNEQIFDNVLASSFFRDSLGPGSSIASTEKTDEGGLSVIIKQKTKPYIAKLMGVNTAGIRQGSIFTYDKIIDILIKNVYGNSEFAKNISFFRQRVAKIQQKNIATYVDEGARRLGLQLSMKWKDLGEEIKNNILSDAEIKEALEHFFVINGTIDSNTISLQERVFNKDGKIENPLQTALKYLNTIAKKFYDQGIIEEESLFTFDEATGQYYLPKTWIGAGQLAIASNEKLSTPNNIKHGFKEERALRDLTAITGTNIKDIFPRYVEDLQKSPEYGFYKKQVEALLALSFNTDKDALKKMTTFDLDNFKDIKRINSDAYLRSGSLYATKEEIKTLPSVIFAQKVLEDLKEKAINIEDIKSIEQLFKDKKYGVQLGQYFAKNLNGKTGTAGIGLGNILPLFMDLEFLKSVASIQNDLETAEDNEKLELNYIDSMRVMDAVIQNINDIKQDYKLDALKKQEYIGNLVADYGSSLNENVNTDEGTIFERYNKIALKGSRMLKDAALSYKELSYDTSYDFLMNDKVWMDLTKESLLSLDEDERDKKIIELIENSIYKEKPKGEDKLTKEGLLKDTELLTNKKQIKKIKSQINNYGDVTDSNIKQLVKKYFSDKSTKSLNLLLRGVANRATLKNDGTAKSFIWALINRFPSIAGMDIMALKGQLVRGDVLRDHIAINPDLQRAFNADNDGDIIATAVIMGEIEKLNQMHEYTNKAKEYADILLKEDLKFISPKDESKITSSGGAPMETEDLERDLEQEAKKKAFIDAQVQEGKRSIGLFSYLNTGVAETLKQKSYLASSLLSDPNNTNVAAGAAYGDILRGFLTTLEQDAISAKKIGDVYDKAAGESEKAKKEVADGLDGIKRAQNIIIDSTNWTQANFHKVLEEARKILGKKEDESLLNNRVLTLLAAKAEQIGGAYLSNFKKILGIDEKDDLKEYINSDKFKILDENGNKKGIKGITGDQLTKALFGDEQRGISGLGAALSQGIFKQFKIRELIEKAHQYIPGRAYPYFNMTPFERRDSQEERDFIQFVTSDKEEAEFLKQTLGEIEQTYNGYKTLSEWAGSRQASFKKVLKEIVKQEKNFHDFKSHVSPHSLIHDFLPSKYGQGVSPEISKDIFEQQILEKGKTFEQLQSEFGYSEDFLQSFLESQILFSQGKIVHAAQESVGNKKVSLEEMREIFQKKGSPIEKPLAEYLMLLKSSKNQEQTAELDDETKKELESLVQLSLGGNKLNQALSNYGYNIIGQELVSGGYLQKKAVSGISDVLFFKEATDTERAKLMIGDYKTNKGAVLPSDILQTIIYGGLFKQIQADIQEQFKEKGAGDFEAYLESGSAVAESLIKNFEHTATTALKLTEGTVWDDETTKKWEAEIERQKKKWRGDEKDPNNPGIFNILKNNEQLDYLGAILHLSPLTGTGEIKTFNMFGPRDTVPWGALAALEAGRSLTPEMEEELKGAVSTFYSTDIEGIEDKTKTKDSLIAKLTEKQKEELKKYQASKEKILKIREEQRKLDQQLEKALSTVDDEKAAKIQEQILSNQKELEELGSSKFITEGSGLNQKQNLADLKTIIDAEFENKESKQKANEFISSATRVKNRNEIFDINIKKLRKTTPELLKIKTSISELESIQNFRKLTEEEESTLDDLKESSKTIEEKIHRLQLGIEDIIDEQQESVELLKSAQKSTQKTVIKTNKTYNKSEKKITQDKFKNLSRQFGSGKLFKPTDIIEQSILDKRRQYQSYSPDGLENKEKLAQEEASLIRRKEDLKDLKKWRSLLSAVSKSEDEVQKIREDLRKTSDTQEQQLLQEQLDAAEIVLEHNRNQVEEFKRQRGKEENGKFVWNSSREEQIYEQANTLTNAERILKKKKENGATSSTGLFGSLDDSLISWFSRFFSGGILVKGLQVFLKEVNKMINQAKELDKVMTNVRIVTNGSISDTRNLISEYSKLGKELGVTTKEVAQSGIEWMRQGYEAVEANKLIKASLYLSKLGMIDSTTATKSLTSALKGFKLEASDAMKVVDKLTAIDLKAATSAGDIAEGLSQFANIGSLAGVDIDQAAAYVATIADVTQMGGSSAGQALKTIISRYGNVKAGAYNKLNIGSENIDTGENLNDVEKVLSKIGISIRNSNLQFKDFDTVLAEIAEKWESLDNVSKKAIANAFAGVRQQEGFVTLLENWDKYEELLNTSRTSAGTAEKKYASYQESLEAAVSRLQTTIEDFTNKAEISNLLTVLTNIGTGLAESIPFFIRVLPQLIAAIENLKIVTGDSFVQKLANSDKLQNWWNTTKSNVKGKSQQFVDNIKTIIPKNRKNAQRIASAEDPIKEERKITAEQNKRLNLAKLETKFKNQTAKLSAIEKLKKGEVLNNEETMLLLSGKGVKNAQIEEMVKAKMITSEQAIATIQQRNNAEIERSVSDRKKDEEFIAKLQKMGLEYEEQIKKDREAGAQAESKTPQTNGNIPNNGLNKTQNPNSTGSSIKAGATAALSYVFNQATAALSTYLTAGTTHKDDFGNEVTSSEAARKMGRNIETAFTLAIPFIGSAIGSLVSQHVMKDIDRDRDTVNHISEEANKKQEALDSVQADFQNIKNLAHATSASDIDARNLAVENYINTLYKSENSELRQSLENNLGTIIKKLGIGNGETITLNELMQKYQKGDSKIKERIAKALEIAQKREERNQQQQMRLAEQYKYQEKIGEARLKYQSEKKGYASNGLTHEQNANAYVDGISTGVTAGAALGTGIHLLGAAAVLYKTGAFTGPAAIVVESIAAVAAIAGGILIAVDAVKAEQEKAKAQAMWDSKFTQEKIDALLEEESNIRNGIDTANKNNLEAIIEYRKQLQAYAEWTNLQNEKDNKLKLEEGLLKAKVGDEFLMDLSLGQLRTMRTEDIYKSLADVVEKTLIGMSVYTSKRELTEEFISLATPVLKEDEDIEQLLTGTDLSLNMALKTLDPTDRSQREILQNFATALNTSIGDLSKQQEAYGNLSLSDLLKTTTELTETVEQYTDLISDLSNATKTTSGWMETIIKQFPDLVQYMGDIPVLMQQIMNKVRELSNRYIQEQWEELASNKEYFKTVIKPDILNLLKQDETLVGFSNDDFEKLINKTRAYNINSLRTYLNGAKMEVTKKEGEEGYEDELKEVKGNNALYNALSQAGAGTSLISDIYKDRLQQFMNVRVQLMDQEIDSLTKQKEMLQEVNNQREYENRLIEARNKLEDAQNEKKRVYRAGVGWVYEADQKKIEEAQKNLKEVQKEKDISAITKQIDLLMAEKDEWSNYFDKKSFELEQQQADAFAKEFGLDGALNSRLGDIYQQFDTITKKGGLFEGITQKVNLLTTAILEQDKVDVNNILHGNKETDEKGNFIASETDQKSLEDLWNIYVGSIGKDNENEALQNFTKRYSAAVSKGINMKDWAAGLKESEKGTAVEIGEGGYNKYKVTPPATVASLSFSDIPIFKDANISMESDGSDIDARDANYVWGDMQKSMEGGKKGKAARLWIINENNEAQGEGYTMDSVDLNSKLKITSEDDNLYEYAQRVQDIAPRLLIAGCDGETEWAFLENGSVKKVNVSSIKIPISSGATIPVQKNGKVKDVTIKKDGLFADIAKKKLIADDEVFDMQNGYIDEDAAKKLQKLDYIIKLSSGSLNVPKKGLALINELGAEALVTPSGTLTALPSHTGVVPADITKNLWSLGELAPSILRALQMNVLSNFKPVSGLTNSLDESLNVNNLTMNVNTGGSFDARQFVQSLKEQAALTRNLR